MVDTPQSVHPQYASNFPDWEIMDDSYAGERVVKSKRHKYLFMTESQIADGAARNLQPGAAAYESYLGRARYPGFVAEAIRAALGMMQSKDPQISLPAGMENVRSVTGESPKALLHKINEQQLLTGRLGLLVDIDQESSLPYISLYRARHITNWDYGQTKQPDGLQRPVMVVLDESGPQRVSMFEWENRERYRILSLGRPGASFTDPIGRNTYHSALYEVGAGEFNSDSFREVSLRGRTLDRIPFYFVNVMDISAEPETPPLLDLANLCLSIYRQEADYRQNLYQQGQDTLITIGANLESTDAVRVGTGARLDLPLGADAKFIGVTSDGLSEQRASLEGDRMRAGSMGAQTIDSVSRERESGTSLSVRMSARTANLNSIAMAGAFALEHALRDAAEFLGLNPDEVSVVPNLDFGGPALSGQNMVEMATARNLGFPISARTLHERAVAKGLFGTSFEEEISRAENEKGGPFELPAKTTTGDRSPDNQSKSIGAKA